MNGFGKKNVSMNILVKKFLRDHNIPTKRDVDKLMRKLEQIEKMLQKNLGASAATAKSASRKRKVRSAADKVLDVIRQHEDGIKFSDIQEKTGFEEKKLRNIIYRLTKVGKVDRFGRGVYFVP